jgi:hypothetical protein
MKTTKSIQERLAKMPIEEKAKRMLIMKRKQKVEARNKNPKYLTEAHKKNSEAAMKQITKDKTLEIDWNQEIVRQKWNATDH